MSHLHPVMAAALAPFAPPPAPAKLASSKYQGLLSMARQHDYYATCPTNALSAEARARWAESAARLRAEAEALPDDFVDPPFVMPEWGTKGT